MFLSILTVFSCVLWKYSKLSLEQFSVTGVDASLSIRIEILPDRQLVGWFNMHFCKQPAKHLCEQVGIHLSNLKKYFLHVQSIHYIATIYLGVHLFNFKNTSFMCKVFNTLHLNTWTSLYPTLKKTSCTCKVFITLHWDTWGSIYPTSKKYFMHVQSIQYFALIYLGAHISNFDKYFLHV